MLDSFRAVGRTLEHPCHSERKTRAQSFSLFLSMEIGLLTTVALLFSLLTTSAVLSSVRSVCQILHTLCFLFLSVTQSFRPETSHGAVWHNKWLVGRVALVLPPTEPSCSHRHPCVAQLGTGRVQGALFFLSIRASDGFVMIGENAFPFQCALKRAHR